MIWYLAILPRAMYYPPSHIVWLCPPTGFRALKSCLCLWSHNSKNRQYEFCLVVLNQFYRQNCQNHEKYCTLKYIDTWKKARTPTIDKQYGTEGVLFNVLMNLVISTSSRFCYIFSYCYFNVLMSVALHNMALTWGHISICKSLHSMLYILSKYFLTLLLFLI